MEDPPELRFEAGQWVSVPFGPKNVRAYSIASTPRFPQRITLSADVAPGGLGSTWFRGLKVGQTVNFKGPFGGFVFNRDDPRRPLFVAEEIGIVPARSILTDLDATGFAHPTMLVYWGRSPAWMPYHADFVALAHRHPAFAYHSVRGEDSLPATVDELVPDVAGLAAYVSGGRQMIDAVRAVLMAKGMERKSVKWEKFW